MALRTGIVPITALASATSANGTVRNGATLPMSGVKPGSLAFETVSAITTSSVTATFALQASKDGSTWYDVYLPALASVASSAGTGSAVTTRRIWSVPVEPLSSFAFVRMNATLSGAVTAAADQTTVLYHFRRYGVED
jgi:hypothetical protein